MNNTHAHPTFSVVTRLDHILSQKKCAIFNLSWLCSARPHICSKLMVQNRIKYRKNISLFWSQFLANDEKNIWSFKSKSWSSYHITLIWAYSRILKFHFSYWWMKVIFCDIFTLGFTWHHRNAWKYFKPNPFTPNTTHHSSYKICLLKESYLFDNAWKTFFF